MGQILSGPLMLVGAGFMLLAALGVARMPDLFTRMHASTKSATLGVGCLMLGAALHFGDAGVTARALAVVAFLFATAPVAAHMIARAGYLSGVPLWEGTLSDELRGRYDMTRHTLGAGPTETGEPGGPARAEAAE
jgi:multicomponent Na+:H+ antiporter subunit G